MLRVNLRIGCRSLVRAAVAKISVGQHETNMQSKYLAFGFNFSLSFQTKKQSKQKSANLVLFGGKLFKFL